MSDLNLHRRDVLAGLAGAYVMASIAGCLGRAEEPTTTVTPDGGGVPVAPSETTFNVNERQCGEGKNVATISRDGGDVMVEGVIAGRDTCDTARAAVTMESGTLVLTVNIEQKPTTGTPACAECITDIEYEFAATFPNEGPSNVRVVHQSATGVQTVAEE